MRLFYNTIGLIPNRARIFLIGMAILSGGKAVSQEQEYNHPELKWNTNETAHFFIHFHQGEDRTALQIQAIAEAIYGPVTAFYGYEPDEKIHLIIRDHDDNSNGAAFYYDNKIEIWASAMDFVLRGNHNWLRNVVTHEFVHMISLGAARKTSRQIPAVYFQWIGYEEEKRTDVIHGYPNVIASVPISGTVMPMWFAEGMSQIQIPGWWFDSWDTHRDMLLRTAALDQGLLTFDEMGVFGKNSIGNERVYNQGYALVLFIAERYGEETLAQLARAMKAPFRMGFNGAVQSVLHKTESDLYLEWADWILAGYRGSIRPVHSNLAEGGVNESDGTGNFFPLFSPDGSQYAFLSNRGRDYLSLTSLWIRASGKAKKAADGVSGRFSWSPEGNKIVFARAVQNARGSHFYDLFVYDAVKRKEKRITRSARLRDPDWSPDNSAFACISERDGTANLFLVSPDGKKIKSVTAFRNGEQLFTPHWVGKTGRIVFSISANGDGRDIAEIDSSGNGFKYLIKTVHDERDPFPDRDGRFIFYASDATGIFNIRRYHVETDTSDQVTNVMGGAFTPAVNSSGALLFSLFRTNGYSISRMDSLSAVRPENTAYTSPYEAIRNRLAPLNSKPSIDTAWTAPASVSRPYKPIFSKLSFYPKVMVDFPGKIKVGSYFSGSDFLDKISVFGGAALNGQMDTDLFLIFQYRFLYPTLFIEAYQIGRHTSEEEFKYSFNLMETDIGADWRLSDRLSLRTVWQFSRYDAAQRFSYEGQRIKIPYTYHVGNLFGLFWKYRVEERSVYSDISPKQGRSVDFRIDRAWQRFMNGFAVHQDYGTLVEMYAKHHYFQYSLDWKESFPGMGKDHGVGFRMQAGCIDRSVDSFYHFFAGGLDGLKGYPYYSISGTQMAQFTLSYRFPVIRKWGKRLSWIHLDNVFLSAYGQAGNAWTGRGHSLDEWKKDVGLQLRLGLFSFYGFPMAFTFDAAYGLDRLVENDLSYGRELRTYFGILFDFLD